VTSPSFLSVIVDAPDGRYALLREESGLVLATRVEPAFDSRSRRRGLLGRDTLEEDAALIIAPCSGIHTFFMRFSIDVVFVTRAGRVLKTSPLVPPWRMRIAFGAFAVIEFPAGTIARSHTNVGDALRLARSEN
jgi:uncharacterized membrane protein (UPF0127 family)